MKLGYSTVFLYKLVENDAALILTKYFFNHLNNFCDSYLGKWIHR